MSGISGGEVLVGVEDITGLRLDVDLEASGERLSRVLRLSRDPLSFDGVEENDRKIKQREELEGGGNGRRNDIVGTAIQTTFRSR